MHNIVFSKFVVTFQPGKQLLYKVIDKSGEKDACTLKITVQSAQKPEQLQAMVRAWVPVPEQKGILYADIKDGDKV